MIYLDRIDRALSMKIIHGFETLKNTFKAITAISEMYILPWFHTCFYIYFYICKIDHFIEISKCKVVKIGVCFQCYYFDKNIHQIYQNYYANVMQSVSDG